MTDYVKLVEYLRLHAIGRDHNDHLVEQGADAIEELLARIKDLEERAAKSAELVAKAVELMQKREG